MGWLWRSSNQSQPSKEASDAAPSPPPSTANVNPVEAQLGQQQQQEQQHQQQLTREQQADADLQAFLRELNSSTQTKVAQPDPSSIADPEDTSTRGRPSPLVDTTYPTTMSCRDAFDYAFHCQSLGGQLTNWYRYGTLRSCSDRWDDFWFCMRTRGYGQEERAKEIMRHFAAKESKYREALSSEDVWEQRRPGDELKDPFMKDPDLIDIPGLPKRRKPADEA